MLELLKFSVELLGIVICFCLTIIVITALIETIVKKNK